MDCKTKGIAIPLELEDLGLLRRESYLLWKLFRLTEVA